VDSARRLLHPGPTDQRPSLAFCSLFHTERLSYKAPYPNNPEREWLVAARRKTKKENSYGNTGSAGGGGSDPRGED
jgi:hypothetical protein